MKLFVDHNISPRIARALNALFEPDHRVVALQDKFDRRISDVEYLRALYREGGWSVLTRDKGIKSKPHEREAWRQSELVVFFLAPGWAKLSVAEQAARLIRWWPAMTRQVDLVAGSALFELGIGPGGRFRTYKL